MKENDKFIRKNPITGEEEVWTYTGTKREVKGVLFEFFTDSKGRTCFFYPSEVLEEFKILDAAKS